MVIFGERFCGLDTDEVFAYSTQKVVWIRDRWIGFFYYFLILLVLLWVVGDQILWRNDHFQLKDVSGMPRMWLSHPTVNNCDPGDAGCRSAFRKLVDLPYCDVYQGEEQYGERAHCEYKDRISLQDSGSRVQSVFIPTAIELVTEKRHCHPGPENSYSCDNVYETLPGSDCVRGNYLCKSRGNRSNQFYYVADINNFAIRFTSSYERGDIRGTSLMHQAYMGVCNKLVRLANNTQTWSDRKNNAKFKCAESELEMEKLPCLADCAKVRAFDQLEDKGVSVAGRQLGQIIGDQIKSHLGIEPVEVDAEEAMSQVGVQFHSRSGQGSRIGSGPRLWPGRSGGGRPRLRPRARTPGSDHLAFAAEPGKEEPRPAAPGPADMYSDNWGDVFKVRKLLELAGANLDRNFNMDGWSGRQAGTVLEVQAVYSNLHPIISSLGYKPVSFHYTVRQLTIPYVSRLKLSAVQPDDYPNTRYYEVQYGLLIYFKVSGSFGFFNLIYLIVMLTAAFALTSTATTLTDFVGLYLHPRRQNYFHLKYEVSPDFSETWECPKCGYHNPSKDERCQGHDKWTSPKDSPPCGVPRPET